MKRLSLFVWLAAFASLAASTAFAQPVFEGRVKMSMQEGRSKALPMTYSIKKDFIRVDLTTDDGSMASIMDFQKKEIIVLMPGQPMYMAMPMQDVAETAKQVAQDTPPLQKTGETETILGYLCTKYITQDKEGVTEIWAAEGIGTFAMANSNPMKPAPRNAWEKELMDKGFFPLRVVTKAKNGRERFRLDVTAIEKGSLDAKLFTVPDGYERFDMGNMMKGALKGIVPRFGR